MVSEDFWRQMTLDLYDDDNPVEYLLVCDKMNKISAGRRVQQSEELQPGVFAAKRNCNVLRKLLRFEKREREDHPILR